MFLDDDDDVVEEEVVEREPQITSEDPAERKLARKLRIERRLEAMRKNAAGDRVKNLVYKVTIYSERAVAIPVRVVQYTTKPHFPTLYLYGSELAFGSFKIVDFLLLKLFLWTDHFRASRRQNMPEGEEEEVEIEKTLLQKQLEKSFDVLDKLKADGDQVVSNVLLASDSREVDRTEAEWQNRQIILAELQEEAELAEEKFNEISDKWLSILDYNDPLFINDEILLQKEKCDDLIKQKDEIIAMLKVQLNKAEISFTKDQKKQTNDVQTLADRIDKQVTLMRHAYQQELEMIEDVIEMEKQLLIEANDKRWDELFRRRDQEEEINSDKKFQQMEEFEEMCNQLRINHQEKYRGTKIKLENDIEMLEIDLEKIKYLALINGEKLDYNYQILKKREDENIIIKSQQKRKINKLQDAINTMRNKIRDYLTDTNNEIDHLTFEVKKLQGNIIDIEAKADHFSQFNDVKYRQLWEMNNKIATDLLGKILTTDRVLHEQQMGMEWISPEESLLNMKKLPSYISAMEELSRLYKTKPEDNSSAKKSQEQAAEEANANKEESAAATTSTSQLVPEGETMAHRRLLKLVLKLIADKSGFLIEERLADVLKPYSDDEKTLIKIDNVFAALGVKRPEEVEVLLEYFLPYTHCPICMRHGPAANLSACTSEVVVKVETLNSEYKMHPGGVGKKQSREIINEETSQEENEINPSTIITDISAIMSAIHQPQNIIEDIVQKFANADDLSSFGVSDSQKLSEEDAQATAVNKCSHHTASEKSSKTKSVAKSSRMSRFSCQNKHPLVISSVYVLRALREFVSRFYVPKKGIVTMSARLSYKRSTISRLLVGEDVDAYWDKFKEVFSSSREALWDGLMIGMQKYYEILKDRRKMNDEVIHLRRQNIELTHLLSCYEKDLEKKMKPPCALERQDPIKPKPLNLVPKDL